MKQINSNGNFKVLGNTDSSTQQIDYESVTILLDENLEKIIGSIIKEDETLNLGNYSYSSLYLKKLGVICNALNRGFEELQFDLDEIKTVSLINKQKQRKKFRVIKGNVQI